MCCAILLFDRPDRFLSSHPSAFSALLHSAPLAPFAPPAPTNSVGPVAPIVLQAVVATFAPAAQIIPLSSVASLVSVSPAVPVSLLRFADSGRFTCSASDRFVPLPSIAPLRSASHSWFCSHHVGHAASLRFASYAPLALLALVAPIASALIMS